MDSALQEKRIRDRLRSGDFTVRHYNGADHVVCSYCGGNCGQCGYTDVIGNAVPATLAYMLGSWLDTPRVDSMPHLGPDSEGGGGGLMQGALLLAIEAVALALGLVALAGLVMLLLSDF